MFEDTEEDLVNPFEVTTSELAIELLFPANRATTEALKKGQP